MPNPFDQFDTVQAGPPAPVVVGTPRPEKPKDPPSGFRWGPGGSLEAIPGGPADKPPTDPKLVEAERTAAFLATRIAGGMADIDSVLATTPSAATPEADATILSIFGSEARNWANSPARRQIEGAQLDILDAALTLGTGAAYTREQIEGYRQSYFPSLTDDDATIKAKQARLKRLLEAAKLKAGGAAPKIDEALQLLNGAKPDDRRRTLAPDEEIKFADEPVPPKDPALEGLRERNVENYTAFNSAYLNGANEEELWQILQQRYGTNATPEWRQTIRKAIREREQGRPRSFVPGPVNSPPLDISDARTPDEGGNPIGMTGAILTPQNADAAVRGAADVVTAGLADEIAAAGDTIFGDGTYQENLYRQRGIDAYDQQNNPYARFAGQMGGALLLPSRVAQAGTAAGRTALRGGLGRAEAIVAARQAGTRRLAGESGAYGALYGFGSTEGDVGDRLTGAATTGALSTVTGYGLGRLGGALGARQQTRAQANALAPDVEAARAASALDIDLPRFVAGGVTAQNWGRRLEQAPFGRARITEATDTMIDQSRAARDAIAERAGTVRTVEDAAEVARAGASASNAASRSNVSSLYRAAETEAEGADITPQATMQTLAQLVRAEGEVPGGTPVLPILQHYAQSFEGGGPITIRGARKMRSTLRSRLRNEGGLTSSDADRITQMVMRAVGDDIETSLRAAGREAAIPLYRQADRAHAERLTTVDDVLTPFIGKDGDKWGSDVAKAINGDAKGNGERLQRFLDTLQPDEADSVRASLIAQLGRSRSGSQDAAGEAFSLDEFLTNWDQIRGARERIFGADTLRDLNRLARVAQRAKATNRSRGHSNTGADVWAAVGTALPGMAGVGGLATGSGTTFTAGLLATAGVALAQNGGARLLASPGFARRLAETPTNPRAAARFWSQPWVAKMASRNPSIAAELTGFQQAFVRAANDNARLVTSSAASDRADSDRNQ